MEPLWTLLSRRFEEQPEEWAVHADGRWWSYGELSEGVRSMAGVLADAGVEPGDRVAVMLPNGVPFVQLWLATVATNTVLVPVNIHLVGEGLRDVIERADPGLLVVAEEFAERLTAVAGDRRIIVSGGEDDELGRLARGGPEPRFEAAEHDDLAMVMFTSGTTGPQKGVMLSRLAQTWHGLNYQSDFIRLGPGEVGYTPLPLFHISAQGFVLGCLLGGAGVVIDRAFSPFGFWRTVREHGAKAFNYVGAMVPLLWERSKAAGENANPLERGVGSATPVDLHEAFEERFGLELIETYGQTEFAGLWFMNSRESREIGTAGRPARWFEAGIFDEDGQLLRSGETGELGIYAEDPELVVQGYFNDAAATAEAYRGGWYMTGDVCELDQEGRLRFRGRLKDFIRRRGENISAFEVERAALSHPAVAEAAAVGVPAVLGEEEVKLCVIPREGMSLDPAMLAEHLGERMAAFMQPAWIEVREEFPRTPTLRVQKHLLRKEGVPEGGWKPGRRPGERLQRDEG